MSRNASNELNGIRISKDGTETERESQYIRRRLQLTYVQVIVPCTRLIITSGAWSPRVFSSLFPKSTVRIPISSLAGHSLLVRNPSHDPSEEQADAEVCHALFATDDIGFSPELFSRVGGELYLAGLNSTMIPLPEQTQDVKVDEKAIEQMKRCAAEMIGATDGKEMEVLRESLVNLHRLRVAIGMLISIAVLQTCNRKRTPTSLSDPRREIRRRLENAEWQQWRSLSRRWSRCLGNMYGTWHRTSHGRNGRRKANFCKHLRDGITAMNNQKLVFIKGSYPVQREDRDL